MLQRGQRLGDMPAYLDFSEYARRGRLAASTIGWIGKDLPFNTGGAEEGVLLAVWRLSRVAVSAVRGQRYCQLCPPREAYLTRFGSSALRTGYAELRVFGSNGVAYAAPDLLLHNMRVHHYMPPRAFIEALLWQDGRPDHIYIRELESRGLLWFFGFYE